MAELAVDEAGGSGDQTAAGDGASLAPRKRAKGPVALVGVLALLFVAALIAWRRQTEAPPAALTPPTLGSPSTGVGPAPRPVSAAALTPPYAIDSKGLDRMLLNDVDLRSAGIAVTTKRQTLEDADCGIFGTGPSMNRASYDPALSKAGDRWAVANGTVTASSAVLGFRTVEDAEGWLAAYKQADPPCASGRGESLSDVAGVPADDVAHVRSTVVPYGPDRIMFRYENLVFVAVTNQHLFDASITRKVADVLDAKARTELQLS